MVSSVAYMRTGHMPTAGAARPRACTRHGYAIAWRLADAGSLSVADDKAVAAKAIADSSVATDFLSPATDHRHRRPWRSP